MLNKTAASETITNIEHIMYGDGFSELVKKVSEDEHTPVQHTFYFSHLPEDMLKSISSSKIDSTINEKMTKSREQVIPMVFNFLRFIETPLYSFFIIPHHENISNSFAKNEVLSSS